MPGYSISTSGWVPFGADFYSVQYGLRAEVDSGAGVEWSHGTAMQMLTVGQFSEKKGWSGTFDISPFLSTPNLTPSIPPLESS